MALSGKARPGLAVLLSGIGGQGIQLVAKSLALAATRSGLDVMMSSEVGGEMRGGPSLASVVLGEQALTALPVLERADILVLAHHRHSEWAVSRVDPAGLAVVNSSIIPADHRPHTRDLVGIDASAEAGALGASQAAGFVLLGALVRLTGLVELDAVASAMRELLPPYRARHAGTNEAALARGAELVGDGHGIPTPWASQRAEARR